MFEVLKIVHLLALAAGVATSLVSSVMMPRLARAAATGVAPGPLAGALPVFGRIGVVAIVLLWITGIWMILDRYDGDFSLNGAFSAKLAFVVLLTIDIAFLTYSRIQSERSRTPPPSYVRFLGMASGLFLLLIVIFAVYAFN